MTFDPLKHHRRSIRLKGYDYTKAGFYFVTICTQNRESLFGEILAGNMLLNAQGRMVYKTLYELAEFLPNIRIDTFQVMPNHIHAIIEIVGVDLRVNPKKINLKCNQGQTQRSAPTDSLPQVIKKFKTITTRLYIDGVKKENWLSLAGKLWQRNYYEHIIRDENELIQIREYIINNPKNWDIDEDNPENIK